MKKILIPVCVFIMIIIFLIIRNGRNNIASHETYHNNVVTSHYDIDFKPGNLRNINIKGGHANIKIFITNKNVVLINVNKMISGHYEKDFLLSHMAENNLITEVEKDDTLCIESVSEKSGYNFKVTYDLDIYLPRKDFNFIINTENLTLSVFDDYDGDFSLNFKDGEILFKNFYGKLNINAENARINVDNGFLKPGSGFHINNKGNIYLGALLTKGDRDYIFETVDGSITINSECIRDFNVVTSSLIIDSKSDIKNIELDHGKPTIFLKAEKGMIKFY